MPCFGPLPDSATNTAEAATRHALRQCRDAHAGARVAAESIDREFAGRTFRRVTSDHDERHSTEGALRAFTDTEDLDARAGTCTRFPGATAGPSVPAPKRPGRCGRRDQKSRA